MSYSKRWFCPNLFWLLGLVPRIKFSKCQIERVSIEFIDFHCCIVFHCVYHSMSILLLMEIWLVSSLEWLQTMLLWAYLHMHSGLPRWRLVVKNPLASAGDERDAGSIPAWGRSPGGRQDTPLQYSCLENPMDRGACQAIVHRVTHSQTQLKQLRMHTCICTLLHINTYLQRTNLTWNNWVIWCVCVCVCVYIFQLTR